MIIPQISIVIPVFNGSRYLDGLISQFLTQDCKEIELVFVDDGSTDGTHDALCSWKQKVPFAMSVITQKNQGCSAARNAGMAQAKGAYLAFLDVDDAVSDDYVSVLLDCAGKTQDVFVFGAQRVTDIENFSFQNHNREAVFKPITKHDMLMRFWSNPTRLGVYNLLLRRAYLTDCKAVFPVGYKYYEDYDFLLQVFARTEQICVSDQILYYYIMRDGSAMARFNADRINCLQLMQARSRWLEENAPGFAPVFWKWGVSRLYWSVLWQSALSFPVYEEFRQFAEITGADRYLKKLKGYPDALLQISTMVFLYCPYLYWMCVRLVGGRRSKVTPVRLQDIEESIRNSTYFD